MADRIYNSYYVEAVGGATFQDSIVTAPFNANFVKIHWLSGFGPLEYSFDGINTHGKISPPSSPRINHPSEVKVEVYGASQVFLKNTMTVAVTMWR